MANFEQLLADAQEPLSPSSSNNSKLLDDALNPPAAPQASGTLLDDALSPAAPHESSLLDPLANTLYKYGRNLAGGVVPGMVAGSVVNDAVQADAADSAATGKTSAFSKEGVMSDVNAFSITAAQAVNTAKDLLTRPDETPTYLSRESNQKVRALMDGGMDYAQAHQLVRDEVTAQQHKPVQEWEAQHARDINITQEALQDNVTQNPTELQRHAQNTTASLGLSLPAVVAGAATKSLPVALTVGAAPQFPLAYDQSREAGSSHERALFSAGLSTGAEAGGELLPMGKLLKDVGKEGVAKLVMDYVVRDTGSEVVTTGVQNLISQIIDTPEQDWGKFGEATLKDMIDTAIETPIQSALGGGVAHLLTPKRSTDEIQPLMSEYLRAQAAGDKAKAEELHAQITDQLAQIQANVPVGSTAHIPPNVFSPPVDISPEDEADVNNLEPLTDEEMQQKIASIPPEPLAPELTNDGGSAVGLDALLNAQIGNTRKVRANAENYEPDPNDLTPQMDRKILFGHPDVIGQQIGAVKLGPGVYTIGEPSDSRGLDVLEATHQAYEELAKQFAPNATIILSPQTMDSRQAIGMTQRLASGEYVVVPAQARQVGLQEGMLRPDNFNPSSKAKVLDNVSHEFGHVLTMERFFQGVSSEGQLAYHGEQNTGAFSEATIAHFPAEQQGLMREYNAYRQAMKTKNAAWFQHEWMSPALAMQRQLIGDTRFRSESGNIITSTPDSNAETWVKRLVVAGHPQYENLREQLNLEKSKEGKDAIRKRMEEMQTALSQDYLSFDEFMAEKFARYVHEHNIKIGAKAEAMFGAGREHVRNEEQIRTTGLNAIFADIQKSLQKLFTALKRGITLSNGQVYRIRAGETFENWVKSLTRTGQLMEPKKTATELVGTKKAKPKAEIVLPTEAKTETVAELRRTITYGKFSPTQKQELYKLVRENSLVTAHERMIEMLQGKVKLQLDVDRGNGAAFAGLTEEQAKNDGVQNVALKAWHKLGEKSMFFKAFFGDWERGEGSKVVAADGQPLVMYHATQADFDTFRRGDVGFHFGNMLAAHSRMYKISSTVSRNQEELQQQVQNRTDTMEYLGKREAALPKGEQLIKDKQLDWALIPAYLNIRNPVVLSEDGFTAMWNDPIALANKLRDMGILSQEELHTTRLEQEDFMQRFSITDDMIRSEGGNKIRYQMFQPLRARLEAKGFDGIKYENYVEGGTSWVAFKSSQIKTANGTFSKSSKIHLQRDIGLDEPVGLELDTLASTVERYEQMKPTGVGLRLLARSQWYVLQLQQLAWIHPEFHFLDMANAAAMQYTASKSRLQAMAEGVAQTWMRLGKETDAKLSKALKAEVDEGAHWTTLEEVNGKWTHTATAETMKKLEEHGLTLDTASGRKAIEIYVQSKNVLLQQLLAAQVALARRIGQQGLPKAVFAARLNELKKDFKVMRERPFLPRGDYGSWGLVVTESNGKDRTVVYRRMFEDKKDLKKARDYLEKNLQPNQTLRQVDNFPDEHKTLLAFPAEYIDHAADVLELTKSQRNELYDLLHPVKQEKLTKPYDKALEKIGGGSEDRMRNFANFVWHNSTMIARTEAIPALSRAKNAANEMYNTVLGTSIQMDNRARQILLDDLKRSILFLERTVGYMLSPPNEWYATRSKIALIYLWGSIKTAFLNLVGIITTGSALTSQYGDIAGGAALAKAHKQLTQLLTTGESDALPMELYNRAIQEGFLNQSYAAHLAGAATSSVSKRAMNRNRWTMALGQTMSSIADGGMKPFSMAEQYTRRITFLAQVNALTEDAKLHGQTLDPAVLYTEAIRQTDLLQNSYTLANRPQIMRGTGGWTSGLVPLMTIFLSFMGHFTFNAAGGYTLGAERRAGLNMQNPAKSVVTNTQRMLLLLLVLGGYEALPGMENVMDILDVLMLRYSGKTARQLVREGIQSLPEVPYAHWVNDPHLWSKGLGGDVWGFDISGSLGIGRIAPTTDVMAGTPQKATEIIGKAAPELFGVSGSLGVWATQTALDISNGNDLTKNITKFPGVIGGASSAYEWSQNGVRGPKGELVHTPSTKEIVGKALNFNPTAVSQARELAWAKQEAFTFWTHQRANLISQYVDNRDRRDREGVADTLEAVREFNHKAVDHQMRILPWQMKQAYFRHHQEQRAAQRGQDPRKFRHLGQEIEASFVDEEGQSE